MHPQILLVVCAAGFLIGCTPAVRPEWQSSSTGGLLPSPVEFVAASGKTPTSEPPRPIETPTATPGFPTIEAELTTPPGAGYPLAAIQIYAPGPLSIVVSPLQIQLVAVSGSSRRIIIDLYGADGRLLARTIKAVAGSSDGDALSLRIPFEIRSGDENGYLQISTKDEEGWIRSLNTVKLRLLSNGINQVNAPGLAIYECIVLPNLSPGAVITGGVLELQGKICSFSRQPMIMELVTEQGRTLSLRVLRLSDSSWQSFTTTLPFKVEKSTPARLYVHQADDILDTQVYIYTQAITLNP